MTKVLQLTRTRIANIRSFLAPIRLLPEEILSYILQITFIDGQSPWTFAHVSRSFRIATLNTPMMWDRIIFRTSPTLVRNMNGIERCRTGSQLVNALQRSKKAPVTLTIELKLPVGGDRALETAYRAIPGALNIAADRIRSLTIMDLGFDYYLPNLITRGLKDLRILYISGATKPRRCFETLLNLVDKTALSVHTMTLLIPPTLITPNRTYWQRLATLVIQGIPPLAVVSQCLNLRSLRLRAPHDGATEPLRLPPITLFNLHNLVLEFFPVTFLRSLSLPSLLSLEITSSQPVIATEAFPPFPSLETFLLKGLFTVDPSCFITPSLTSCTILGTRLGGSVMTTPRHYKEWESPSKLAKLVIDGALDETDTILTMLRHHSEVSSLSLSSVTSTPSIIRSLWFTVMHLSGDNGPGPLCPSLKKFRVQFKSPRYKQVAILGMLHAMAMVRESGGFPLEGISFLQFRHGTPVLKALLPLSVERRQADSDSDQSTYVIPY